MFHLEEMRNMSNQHFKRMFRMTRTAFNLLLERLVEELGPDIEDSLHYRMAENSSGSIIGNDYTSPSITI